MITLIALVVGLVPVGMPKALAFCPTGSKWDATFVSYQARSGMKSGWYPEIQKSGNEWNGHANWSMYYNGPNVSGPFLAYVSKKSFKNAGWPAIPGVTRVSYYSDGDVKNVFTWLNSDYSWNTSGRMDQKRKRADVRTVTTHELGHWLILHHPKVCEGPFTDAEEAAVMHPNWTKKWQVNSDDIAGIRYIY